MFPTMDLSELYVFHTFSIFKGTATENSGWHIDLLPERVIRLLTLALNHSDLTQVAIVGLI